MTHELFNRTNLARLSAVAKSEGFETKILDVNVKAYNYIRKFGNLKVGLIFSCGILRRRGAGWVKTT